ncbi:hypothetical protein V1264_014419 [Littorina saxatilis]|uniref:Uncharacterized protein n=2 Tax=Littorina saxatilis TaxID=31220 RepID=A0AAN9GKZ6_9CAEN
MEPIEPGNDDKSDVCPEDFLVYGRQPGGGNDAIPDVTYFLTPGNTETPGPGQPCRAQDGKRTKRRVPRERICWVCGDRAIAHNFGALTCETCKAFFRRNAHRAKEIPQCNFDSNCNISKNTRRFCTACRMKKCFVVGMDPSLILDEEEKKAMKARRRVKQKLREKLHNQVVSSTSVLSPQVVSSSTTPIDQPTPISSPRAAAERQDCLGALPYFFTTTDTHDPMNTLFADSTRDDQDPPVQQHASNISTFQESRTNTPTSSDARSQTQLLSSLCMSPISAAISAFYSEDSLKHASSSGPQSVAASPNLAGPAATTSTPRSGFKSEQSPATASSSQSAYSSYLTASDGTQQPCVASDQVQSTNHQSSEVFGQSSTATTPRQGSLGSFSQRCSDQSSPAPNPHSASIQGSGLDQPTLAQGRGFRHVEREELPWDIQMYWRLTTEERSLLTQLTSAYTNIQIVQPPPEQPENFHPEQQPLCVDNLIYILDATLRKCVNFAKTVEDFRQLREADQIACLKASALETYTLRSTALFIIERNAWHTFKGDMQLADLQAKFQDHTSIQFFADYCTALKSVAKTNTTLYALLHCLTLFTVRGARLEDRQQVSALKDKYLLLLKHYLESEFSYSHAGRYLVELMALLEDMHNLRHKVMGFYKQFSSFFRPLVAEFFTA